METRSQGIAGPVTDDTPEPTSGPFAASISMVAGPALPAMPSHVAPKPHSGSAPDAGDVSLFFWVSLDLLCIASPQGRLLKTNHRWQDVLGWTAEELTQGQYLDLVHPEDVEPTLAAMRRLDLGGDVVRFVNRYRHKDGHYRWLEWSSKQNPHDGLVYASARDQTDFITAQTDLRQSNETLSLINTAQQEYIATGLSQAWWDATLQAVLKHTGSEFGFIGVLQSDATGPYLKHLATGALHLRKDGTGESRLSPHEGMIFRNMHTLFGSAITTQAAVIANDFASDPRAHGEPIGHPPLRRFLGLPLHTRDGMQGLVGLANRAAPYDSALLGRLAPIATFLAQILSGQTVREQRELAQTSYDNLRALNARILEKTASVIVAVDDQRRLLVANKAACEVLNMPTPALGASVDLSALLGVSAAVLASVSAGKPHSIEVELKHGRGAPRTRRSRRGSTSSANSKIESTASASAWTMCSTVLAWPSVTT